MKQEHLRFEEEEKDPGKIVAVDRISVGSLAGLSNKRDRKNAKSMTPAHSVRARYKQAGSLSLDEAV